MLRRRGASRMLGSGSRSLRRHAGGTEGQAVVELALVFLVLATMVFGTIEIGRGLSTWVIVTQAAREGARTAAARCTIDPGCAVEVEMRVVGSLAGLADPATARWTLMSGPYQSGNDVTVSVEYDVQPVTAFIAAMVPGEFLTVRGQATMRLE